jgi:hypothetical protein
MFVHSWLEMSEDTTSLYNHFLEWLSAAQGLGLAHLIQDSRVFIDEIVSKHFQNLNSLLTYVLGLYCVILAAK